MILNFKHKVNDNLLGDMFLMYQMCLIYVTIVPDIWNDGRAYMQKSRNQSVRDMITGF